MKVDLKEYKTQSGETILFTGEPDFQLLEVLGSEAGDVWHSSFEQGYKNAFPELVYQTAVFFWYLNDFDNLDQAVSWRINPNAFAVRKSVWERIGGFDSDFENTQMQALDFGFQCLRFFGGSPLYVKGLYAIKEKEEVLISAIDRHAFFRKSYKTEHALYMIFRLGFWKLSEWKAFYFSQKHFTKRAYSNLIPARELGERIGNPSLTYIMPTMYRQGYAEQLLLDLAAQNYRPTQVIVVDATPEDEREPKAYKKQVYPFELKILWQESKGSCRARNEAIALSMGEYLIFGDDDIRIPPDFVENHIRFLQTYKAGACNGLDIRADNHNQNLGDLEEKLKTTDPKRKGVGAALMFSNANSCVKREYVNQLIGNDVNFDGGYGEDSDFGLSLLKKGVVLLSNPYSVNLHLKPPTGGYRFWGAQSNISAKKRKAQPWELDTPVKGMRPVPSPTVMYGIIKQFSPQQLKEYKLKYFFLFLFKGNMKSFFYRLARIPYKNGQFKKSVFYARKLIKLGIRYQ